ncbi:hypothetical protein C5167_017476 [Papaver somniferum]|uniref:Uncharacterized protein n=1 Tax=Papaver somniferum TaxID=3469 RepID=A0A4Y7IJI2_PAPSO|nr:hypothetical protein C5167_017476 [Papaver somniferum]
MGLGFNDYKEAKNGAKPIGQENFEEKKSLPPVVAVKSKEKPWSKQNQTKKKKNKAYTTAEEYLASKEDGGFQIGQKIIDMRGPQVRVLTNLEDLNAEEKARDSDKPMPELQYNIKLILDLAQRDIEKIDRDLRMEREKVVSLQSEKETLQKDAGRRRNSLITWMK